VPHPVFVSVLRNAPHPQRQGLFVIRHPRPVDSQTINGVRVASAAEILLAAAKDLSLLDLVILGDSALHLRDCTVEELLAVAAQRRRGAPLLRTAIPLLDGRSESPWESVLRVLHVAAEVEVEPEKKLYDEWGNFVAPGRPVGGLELDASMSTTARCTATGRSTARTLHENGVS
jgi:hypothetical protein